MEPTLFLPLSILPPFSHYTQISMILGYNRPIPHDSLLGPIINSMSRERGYFGPNVVDTAYLREVGDREN